MGLPRSASAVIIGGGVVGCSIAYHLARRGARDVVVLERESVGGGTTSKAAGGIRVQFAHETEVRFSLESIQVFERFKDEFGADPGYTKIGYLYLLAEPRQLRAFETRIALQRRLGADVRVLTPDDAKRLVPALRVDDLVAGVWGPQDGMAGPAEASRESRGAVASRAGGASGGCVGTERQRMRLSPGGGEGAGTGPEVAMDWGRVEDAGRKGVHGRPITQRARISGGWAGLRPL